MYRADELAIAGGVTSLTLMENAGRAVAEAIVRRFGARAVLVLCGPGNNGGDGFAAARYLKSWGWPVRLAQLGEAPRGDAAVMAQRWDGGLSDFAWQGEGLIVDALYGAGLSRDLPETAAALAAEAKARAIPVVAIDVPSGLDGLTGQPRGAAFSALLTVTFFTRKPGHVLMPGRGLCGEIEVADIGIPARVLDDIAPQLWINGPPVLPVRETGSHKFQAGHALIVSGGAASTGAARLAAEAALRAGDGLVSVAAPRAALSTHAAHLTAIMLKPCDGAGELATLLADRRISAICIGPAAGITPRTRAMVKACLAHAAASVLDADALTAFAADPTVLFNAVRRQTVMTPHDGEFARLFPDLTDSQISKVERARAAALRSGTVVVSKGADTVIAAPDGRAAVNITGTPALATAGSGDVLAGLITGLMAQGLAAFEAAAAAVWLHAEAGRRGARHGLTAQDLPDLIPAALAHAHALAG